MQFKPALDRPASTAYQAVLAFNAVFLSGPFALSVSPPSTPALVAGPHGTMVNSPGVETVLRGYSSKDFSDLVAKDVTMKPSLFSIGRVLLLVLCFLIPLGASAQTPQVDLQVFVGIPAVSGYEQDLAGRIRDELKALSPKTDNLGNVYVTLGSGSPHRLLVASLDEPGYIVSAITADGYLRVQRLPQTAPHPLFDLLHSAQPVWVMTRSGKKIPGVVAGLSVHLLPARVNPPKMNHPDEMYIDIGAASAAEVRAAGVDLLDPIALNRQLYALGNDEVAGVAVGDRFGCAALMEILRSTDPRKLSGTLTVAFVTQQWTGARGLDRLLQEIHPEEMILVNRILARRPAEAGAPPSTTPSNKSVRLAPRRRAALEAW